GARRARPGDLDLGRPWVIGQPLRGVPAVPLDRPQQPGAGRGVGSLTFTCLSAWAVPSSAHRRACRSRPAKVWRRPLPRAQEARRWVSIPRYWVSADRRDSVRRPGGTGPIRLPIRAPPAGPLPVVAGLFTRPGPMPSLPDGRSPPRVRSAPLIGPVRVSPAGARLQLRSFDVDALPDPLAQERLDFVEPVAPIVDGQRDLVI